MMIFISKVKKCVGNTAILALLVLFLIILNGCTVTRALWQKHYVDVSVASAKPDKLLLNKKENKLCVQYSLSNLSGSESKYFIAKGDQGFRAEILEDILSNKSTFQVKSVLLSGLHHVNGSNHNLDALNVSLMGDIPDEYIVFAKESKEYEIKKKEVIGNLSLESEKNVRQPTNSIVDPWLGQENLIKKLVQHVWLKKYGEKLDAQFFPILWIDQNGDTVLATEIYSRLTAADTEVRNLIRQTSGFIVEIKSPKRDANYIKIMLIGNYFPMLSYHPSNPYTNPENLMFFDNNFSIVFDMVPAYKGTIWPEYINGLPFDKYSDCSTKDWQELSLSMKNNSLIFKTKKDKPEYDRPLVLRVLGTPPALILDAVIDIAMTPVVIYLLIFGKGYM